MRKAPCFGCADRHATCHAECDRYKEWAEENRKRREAMNLDKDIDIFLGMAAVKRGENLLIKRTKNR